MFKKLLILFFVFALIGVAHAGTTPPETTFSYEQIPNTTDTNITLSCTDNDSGCKAINYNVNNEGWNQVTGSSGAWTNDLNTIIVFYGVLGIKELIIGD
jgi:hypothetical protein